MVLFVFVLLIAAACAGSGEPDDYNADIEENFTEACNEANDRDTGEPSIDNVEQYCSCVYVAFEENVPYEDFKAEDDLLRDGVENGTVSGIDDLDEPSQEIILACIDETNAVPA